MWEADADGGPVGGGHVDGDVPDLLSPLQWRGGEPGQHIGGGAALDLAEQAASAEGVDEAGVPPVPRQTLRAGIRVLFPAGLAPAGLVDPQDLNLGQGHFDD
ncbi:hypothetical protein GCM10020367_05570 [Streptomyces sannanensis]|uniref:Uncharacterized protein n=1 Tax=Streptomyces sannanensis TaxID=285536 RepID=A0ABP6S5U3_9ACTN